MLNVDELPESVRDKIKNRGETKLRLFFGNRLVDVGKELSQEQLAEMDALDEKDRMGKQELSGSSLEMGKRYYAGRVLGTGKIKDGVFHHAPDEHGGSRAYIFSVGCVPQEVLNRFSNRENAPVRNICLQAIDVEAEKEEITVYPDDSSKIGHRSKNDNNAVFDWIKPLGNDERSTFNIQQGTGGSFSLLVRNVPEGPVLEAARRLSKQKVKKLINPISTYQSKLPDLGSQSRDSAAQSH